jgi:hypothetical protein
MTRTLNGWTGRVKKTARSKATWAAVALAAISCIVQLVNFVRTDLKPVLDGIKSSNEKLTRIEQRLEDHERRIGELEKLKQK